MELFEFLTTTTAGKCLFTMLVSMVPIIELRGGLPFGVALGLPYHLAFPAAVIGNLIPAPFIIVYIRRIFKLMRRYMPRLNNLVDRLEKKAHLKGKQMQKYQYLGLWLFVAIPLPGTGAWTGSLAAAFLDMRLKKAMPAVVLGVLTAGCIMLALPHVGINLFSRAPELVICGAIVGAGLCARPPVPRRMTDKRAGTEAGPYGMTEPGTSRVGAHFAHPRAAP